MIDALKGNVIRGAGAAASVVLLTSCGGGSSTVVRPPSTVATQSTSATPTATTSGPAKQTLTVQPSTITSSAATVHLVAVGFSPGEALVVTECAVKGTKTTSADCNLAKLTSVTADANGRVELNFEVVKGPFGDNHIVCGARQACLVSVTQAALSPTEEADAVIHFR
jgi:hypothetical protein